MLLVTKGNGEWKETVANIGTKLMVSRNLYEDDSEADLKETFEPIVGPRFRGFLGWVKHKLPLSIWITLLNPLTARWPLTGCVQVNRS